MAHHIHPYLLLLGFILLSHQFLLHSVSADDGRPSCPSSFDCEKLGTMLKFPFSNSSAAYSHCGMFTISCDEQIPAIRMANESSGGGYGEVTGYTPPHGDNITRLQIYDQRLHENLKSNNCDTFNNVSFPSSPSASVAISQNLTFLKCKRSFGPPPFKDLYSYNCAGFYLYYKYPNDGHSSIPADHFTDCSLIQLPMKPFNRSLNASNPFELLVANFTLAVHVSADCWNCHQTGGHCQSDYQQYFYCAAKKDKSHTRLILAIAIPSGLILICLLLFIIHRRSRWTHGLLFFRSRKTTSELPLKPDVEDSSIYFGVPVFSYSELEKATNSFDPSKELGDGGFGTVYHGKLQDGREVAVKRLYDHNYKRVTQFMNEVEILTCLHHPNLVTLYGCTSRHSRELLLVYEYIPNGTVADHLHGDRAKNGLLTWPIRMNIAIETASALVYLHASDIIHRDVKTNNILLDNNFSVKVADFGLSRLFPNDVSHISTAPQGTPGYVDPEYHQCYQLTDKSDVYSFGVVLIELISSMPAVDICRHRHEINLANLAINRIQNRAFNELIDSSLGFESDSCIGRMTTSVAEVAFRCLQLEKEMRPTMDEVLEALKEIQEFKDEKF